MAFMRTGVQGRGPRLGRLGGLALLVPLLLLLAACGGNSSGGQGNTSTTGVSTANNGPATPKKVITYCPNGITSQHIAKPALIVSTDTSNDTATAHVGQTIVVELPATNMQWTFTGMNPPTLLNKQQPANVLDSALHRCFWTYQAVGAGTVHLTYIGQPQCNPTQSCPQAQPSDFYPPNVGAGTSAQGTPAVTYTSTHAIQIVFTIQINKGS